MKAVVDRIEDGKIAVIDMVGGGRMLVPVDNIAIALNEGDHLKISIELDPERREKMKKEIDEIKENLLKRKKDNEEKK